MISKRQKLKLNVSILNQASLSTREQGKVKIIATIGPSSRDIKTLTWFVENGVNCFRLNCSHGSVQEKVELITLVRNNFPHVAIILDTQGPEVRTTEVEGGGQINLVQDSTVRIMADSALKTTADVIAVTYSDFVQKAKVGMQVLINDGLLCVEITDIKDNYLLGIVKNGGELKSRRSVTAVGMDVKLPIFTQADDAYFEMIKEFPVDYIALSYVKTADDVLDIKERIKEAGLATKIISKIETQQAVDNLQEIVDVSDSLMVARGDLAIETDFSLVPLYQDDIIRKCNIKGIPVIVATQMLESMIENPVPTRAEVGDIAYAIKANADAIMLSGESANGKNPRKAVETMVKIILRIEEYNHFNVDYVIQSVASDRDARISKAVYLSQKEAGIKNVLVATSTGKTARLISRFQPEACIIAFTHSFEAFRHLQLVRGVYPVLSDHVNKAKRIMRKTVKIAYEMDIISANEEVIVVAGMPIGKAGGTNIFMETSYVEQFQSS